MSFLFPKSIEIGFIIFHCEGIEYSGIKNSKTSTLLYLKWIINKDLLYSTGDFAQCYAAAWMGGEFAAEWMHVYVWLSPLAVHLKYHIITSLLTPI